jgi:general secretion pathway protein I
MKRRPILGGFTLLEVMVAVTILGIALVAIFSSEVGAVRNGARARRLTTATLLARCKMGEIEEMVFREGLPAVSARGVDECCENGEVEGFECEWEIERIVLPDEIMMGPEGEEEGGPIDGLLGAGGDPEGGAPPGGMDLSAIGSDPTALMGSVMSGGGDPIGTMALQFAFPILKPAIEEQVRRATVTVRWHEGVGDDADEEELEIVQFLVAEQPPAALTNAAADAATGAISGAVTGAVTGTPPGTPATGGN